jgi:hypothetical protein
VSDCELHHQPTERSGQPKWRAGDIYAQDSRNILREYQMARRRRADSSSTQPTSNPMTTSRRRSTLRDLQNSSNDGDVIVPKVINAAPSLEKAQMFGIEDPRPASSRMLAMAGRIFVETIPQWLAVGGMLALIFGGCCSNVSSVGLVGY